MVMCRLCRWCRHLLALRVSRWLQDTGRIAAPYPGRCTLSSIVGGAHAYTTYTLCTWTPLTEWPTSCLATMIVSVAQELVVDTRISVPTCLTRLGFKSIAGPNHLRFAVGHSKNCAEEFAVFFFGFFAERTRA